MYTHGFPLNSGEAILLETKGLTTQQLFSNRRVWNVRLALTNQSFVIIPFKLEESNYGIYLNLAKSAARLYGGSTGSLLSGTINLFDDASQRVRTHEKYIKFPLNEMGETFLIPHPFPTPPLDAYDILQVTIPDDELWFDIIGSPFSLSIVNSSHTSQSMAHIRELTSIFGESVKRTANLLWYFALENMRTS